LRNHIIPTACQSIDTTDICGAGSTIGINNRLILGTATFGMDYGATNKRGEVHLEEIKGILQMCRQHGVKELDTAQGYGGAEDKLGEAGVSDFTITTKIDLRLDEGAESVKEKFNQSIKKLRVPKVANLLLHNDERLDQADAPAIAKAMHQLVEEGLVGRVGLSSYEPAQVYNLIEKYGFKVVQLPANALDNRLFQGGLLERFLQNGIEVQIRSVFLQGVLLTDPPKSKKVPSTARMKAKMFRRECLEHGISPTHAALSHVLAASGGIRIVVGVSESEELNQIIHDCRSAKRPAPFTPHPWHKDFDPRNWGK
jgi:aryl-alcohol dehydrogenase-like predicted oxidoreductase